jgi:prepilin-type processing-associated H-X9-DG protein
LRIASGSLPSVFPRQFEDPHAQALNYLFADGQHKYGYSYGLLRAFALDAGFVDIYHCSAEHGVTPRRYGSIEVGLESPDSLVVELRKCATAREAPHLSENACVGALR